jgi:hypothetical protein
VFVAACRTWTEHQLQGKILLGCDEAMLFFSRCVGTLSASIPAWFSASWLADLVSAVARLLSPTELAVPLVAVYHLLQLWSVLASARGSHAGGRSAGHTSWCDVFHTASPAAELADSLMASDTAALAQLTSDVFALASRTLLPGLHADMELAVVEWLLARTSERFDTAKCKS